MTDAESVIPMLGLRRHPEGGHFIETWRSDAPAYDGIFERYLEARQPGGTAT